MNYLPEMQSLHEEMRCWRRHLHRFPETAFEEQQTAAFIIEKLREFGISYKTGLAKTGVVATLSAGQGSKKIALRADMDALFIQEQNQFPHRSSYPGKMHACGHDGHCAMLLGAASYLARHTTFNGTVYFIFQPAEEGRAGAKTMLDEGLFEQFPADRVFGMHNFPDIPIGHFAVKSGPMMAAFDCFEIILQGQATHAAMPHLGSDVIVAAAQLINQVQTIVSRTINPAQAAVLSITQIHAGQTWNALPDSVTLRGTLRCFDMSVQRLMMTKLEQMIDSICDAHQLTGTLQFNPENPGYPITFNSVPETALAIEAAQAVVGADAIDLNPTPSMGSEDFSFMLQARPGCYIWLGNGSSANSCLLHNPHYDFNDEILPVGAAYWVSLVNLILA